MLHRLIAIARMGFNPLQSVIHDTYALALLQPMRQEYLPWTKSAVRPAALCNIVNEVIINNRRTVVEFGAGISTIYLAKALSQTKGFLYSFDEDEGWAARINEILQEKDLAHCAKVIFAPLAPSKNTLDRGLWYDEGVLDSVLADRSVDLVIVDGPRALTPETMLARYPAVPFIKSRLRDSWAIFLDDIGRAGEQRIFAEWEKLLNVSGEIHKLDGGFGLLTKGRGFYSRM